MGKNVLSERTQPSMLPVSFPTRAATYAAGDAGLMFFLLRMTFWLGLVLILLPSGGTSQQAPASEVGASQAISAASATVGDLRQFCTRQPDACTVGSQVATSLGYKAQAGAKMLYDFLTEQLAPKETGSVAGGPHSIKSAMDKSTAEQSSQNTLTPADLTPVWRGPAPRKDAKHAA
jgi:Family of unknown function (DUF5330)